MSKRELNPPAVLPNTLRPFVLKDQVRIGSRYDGGYVLPERLLANSNKLISIGINLDWCFELDVLERFPGMSIISFDYTTRLSYTLWWGISRFFYSPISRKKRHVKAILKPISYIRYISNRRVQHFSKFIGTEPGDKFTNPGEIFARIGPKESVLLKIDIEGGEYTVLDSLLDYHRLITGMIIEFHEIPQDPARFFEQVERIKQHYKITHIHVNNVTGVSQENLPYFLEMTFVRSDFLSEEALFRGEYYVLSQDESNIPEWPEVKLVFES